MSREARRDAMEIIEAALAEVDPRRLVSRRLSLSADRMQIAGLSLDPFSIESVYVVGAGKAGAPMARAVEDALGDRITAGAVVVKEGHRAPGTSRIELMEAVHPVPDERTGAGARRLLELAARAGEGDLVLCLISGGGSALMTLPAGSLSLDDIRGATDVLLKSGAPIGEINVLRKHLTLATGGRLAAAANPARVISLILSDVIGDDLGVIASGPTYPDNSTYGEALEIVRGRGLQDLMPPAVLSHLESGDAGELEETPKQTDRIFERCSYHILASNSTAVAAAAEAAAALGYEVLGQQKPLEGEARERAAEFAGRASREVKRIQGSGPPVCLIAGGETTVTVRGRGTGGRAQEFALAAALGIEGIDKLLIFAIGTDGTDGPTDAAGAFADGNTVQRARAAGLDPAGSLADNDAYHFFQKLGDLIITGPTGTNVNDIYCALCG